MDIKEIKQAKISLRQKIAKAIKTFEEQTTCCVENINLVHMHNVQGGIISTMNVDVEIKL